MPEEWECILAQFKFGVMVGLFLYSAYVRKYREDNHNFTDQKHFERVLDNVIRKLE